MRYSAVKLATKRMLNRDEAGEYVGFPALLVKMEIAGWIQPVRVGSKRQTSLFDANKLDQCCDRLSAGEEP